MALNELHESANQHEEFDPLSDPEERRVLHAALDSFRCVFQYSTQPSPSLTSMLAPRVRAK